MIHAIYIPLIFTAFFLGMATIYYSRSQRSYRRARREFQRSLDTVGWDCGTNTTIGFGEVTDDDLKWAKERIRKRGYNPDVVDEGPDDNQ